MKLLLSLIVLVPSFSFAAARHEVITVNKLVQVSDLHCRVRLGTKVEKQNREIMVLTNRGTPILFPNENFAELEHKIAGAPGCPRQVLDLMIDRSFRRFGHLDAAITLVKDQTASGLNGINECVATYTETATFDFGNDIVLVSKEVRLKKQTDCN